jgi:hypothetical protein
MRTQPRQQPVQAPTGMGYGERKALEDAQRAVPVASPPAAPQVPPTTPGPSSWPIPGSLGPLDRPSERPSEPVTAGLDVGPGPGSDMIGGLGGPPRPELERIRPFLPVLELMASRPDASQSSRAFVRSLRAALTRVPADG